MGESAAGGQLELDLRHFLFHILIREAQVDSGGVDIPVSQLFLKSIKPATAVQEVDSIPVAEQVGVNVSLWVRPVCGLLDNLIRPLFGDVASLAGRKQVVIPAQTPFLGP